MTDDSHGSGRHLAPRHGTHARGADAPPSSPPAGRGRAGQVRRFATLTFLSTVIPGLGLLWTKKRRLGILLLAVTLISLLLLGVLLLSGGALMGAAEVLTANGLKAALIVVLVGLVLWLTSIVLTARATHGRGWSRGGELTYKIFTALMCLVVTMPAAEAVRYVAVTQDAFGQMFINNPKTSQNRVNAFKKKDRVNFLLVGSDAGGDRFKVRTDSLMVASVDTKTGDTTLISIPRNWNFVPFPASNPLHKLYPNGFNCPGRAGDSPCWMDAVWMEATVNHPELFKDDEFAGLNSTRDVVQEITGLPIDYSTVINLKGFQDLVNAMGGVDVTIPKGGIAIGGRIVGGQVVPGSITGRIPEGPQHLDGREALWYSRSRVESGDSDRMRRQRCMVNALVDQSDPVSLLSKFPAIMKVAKENITLDLPQDQLPDLADLALLMKKGKMQSVNLAYPIISDSHPDFAQVRSLIQKGLQRPKATSRPKSSAPSSSSSSTSSSSTAPSSSSSDTSQAVSDTAASC